MLIILNKKVTEYKAVCRISAQLCEEKNAQKRKLGHYTGSGDTQRNWLLSLLAYTFLYECGLF